MSVTTYEEWLAGGVQASAGGFGGGDGLSVMTAFVISEPEHFYKLALDVESGFTYPGSYFRLVRDIDMQGGSWRPIGYFVSAFEKSGFSGIFSGENHTIHNFLIDAEKGSSVGIFGFTDQARIKGLRVGNFKIVGSGTTGALIGFALSTEVVDCHAGGSITSTAEESVNLGGLIGTAGRCVLKSCSSGSSINASGCRGVGGLCGYVYNDTKVTDCRSVRDIFVSSTIDSGGLIGTLSESAVTDSIADVAVNGVNNVNIGGFCGAAYDSRIRSCRTTGDVSNRNDSKDVCVGGFMGHGNSMVHACASSGRVESVGGNGHVGGFAGSAAESQIRSSYCVGDVLGEGRVGGFCGYLNCTEGAYVRIEDCYTASDVEAKGGAPGISAGFVGKIDRDGGSIVIARCYSFGSLSNVQYGFVGENIYATILNCFWRRDEDADVDAVHGVPTLTTEEFARQEAFEEVEWSFDGDDAPWCYTGAISPPRPHVSEAPVLKKKENPEEAR